MPPWRYDGELNPLPMSTNQAGHPEDSTPRDLPPPWRVRPGLQPAHVPAIPDPALHHHPDHRATHRRQPATDPRRAGARTHHHLPAGPLPGRLVQPATGLSPRPAGPRAPAPPGNGDDTEGHPGPQDG